MSPTVTAPQGATAPHGATNAQSATEAQQDTTDDSPTSTRVANRGNRAQRRQAVKDRQGAKDAKTLRAKAPKAVKIAKVEKVAKAVSNSTAKSGEPKTEETKARESKAKGLKARNGNTGDGTDKNGLDGSGKARIGKTKEPWQIVFVPVERIEANPYQPRLSFDPLEMADLVASVREHGVQQPIIVRTCKDDLEAIKMLETNGHSSNGLAPGHAPNGDNARIKAKNVNPNLVRYQLAMGERRLRACRESGRKTVPAIVRDDLSDQQVAEIALVENIQRSNLTVIEEARGYKRLMIEFRMKEERIAKKVGKSVQTIKDTLRLLQLPEEVQMLLSQKKLTASHGHTLLALAPFESVCLSVANHAATVPLTATALSAGPLPNAQALKKKGLLVELDYHTKFDWANVCAACPHKAYVRSGHRSYCLKPLEWKSKQDTAIELQKQEAARVMEEARQAGTNTVDVETLPANSYRDLTYTQLPGGCSGACPCRGEAADPRDPTKKIAICLNPNRLSELKEQEREARREQRQRKATILWNEAKDALHSEVSEGNEARVAFLTVLPTLRGNWMRFGGDPEDWQQMVMQVGRELGMFPDWDTLFDPNTDASGEFAVLQELGSGPLLLLASCLILSQEAMRLVSFSDETPSLDFVLGHDRVSQLELTEKEAAGDEAEENKGGESALEPAQNDLSQEELPDGTLPDGILPHGDPPEDSSIEDNQDEDASGEDGLPNDWPTEAELREGVPDSDSESEGADDERGEENELYGTGDMGADEFNEAGFLHDEADLVAESQSFSANGSASAHNLNCHNADNHNGDNHNDADSDEPYTVEAANADAPEADAPEADAPEAELSDMATSGTEKLNIGVTPAGVQSVTAS